jgi:hypothetical protein
MRFVLCFVASLPFALALAEGCGGGVAGTSTGGSTTSSTSGAGATTTGTTTTGTTGSSTSGTGGSCTASPSGCPCAAPSAGASCAASGAVCTYGDSVVAECRTKYTCTSGAWTETKGQCSQPPSDCPSTEPQDSASCDVDAGQVDCSYPNGAICTCSQCPPLGGACFPMPAKWYCFAPTGAGCPTTIPNAGTACSMGGQACNYPSQACGVTATCTSGAWMWTMDPCPA